MGPREGLDGCGKSFFAGSGTPDNPTRSESLHRLIFLAHYVTFRKWSGATTGNRGTFKCFSRFHSAIKLRQKTKAKKICLISDALSDPYERRATSDASQVRHE